MTRALIIGATGYVGAAVARSLTARGCLLSGLARQQGNRAVLTAAGVEPVDGDLADGERLAELVADFDIVVFAPMISFAAEPPALRAIIAGLGRNDSRRRHLLFTSGSGVVSTESRDGRWNDYTAAEDDPIRFPSLPTRDIRLKTEALILAAPTDCLVTNVISPPLIWGHGGSIQVPQIFASAKKTGTACYLGQGLNLYSNVNVDNLAEVYALAIERGTSSVVYHAVSGEANFREIAEAVASVVGCATRSLDYEEACALWGNLWVDMGLAVNSRIVARRTRADLGWEPRHVDLIGDIRSGSYAERFRQEQSGDAVAAPWQGHDLAPP